jgi:hypothetical protein
VHGEVISDFMRPRSQRRWRAKSSTPRVARASSRSR